MKSLPCVLVLTVLLLGGCDSGRPAQFDVGVCHVFSADGVDAADALGANSVRLGFPWSQIEQVGGEYEFGAWRREVVAAADEHGIKVLWVLGYGNPLYDNGDYPTSPHAVAAFARFSGFVADATNEAKPLIEVWNEWNLGIGMSPEFGKGEPEDYVRVFEASVDAIREERPEAMVLGGSMAGAGLTDDWTLRACQAGMLDHLDALSFHPYAFWMERGERSPEAGVAWLIAELETLLAEFPGGNEVPFYLTEIGWPTVEGPWGVSLETQAQYASRMLFLARAHPRIRGVWWFNLQDKDSESDEINHHFGLRFSDGTPKPSWYAFRDTARLVRRAKSAKVDEGQRDGVRVIEIEMDHGELALVCWAVEPGEQWIFEGIGATRVQTRQQLVGSGQWLPLRGDARGRFTVTAGNMPVMVRGLRDGAGIIEARRLQRAAERVAN